MRIRNGSCLLIRWGMFTTIWILTASTVPAAPQVGDVVFETNFNDPSLRNDWLGVDQAGIGWETTSDHHTSLAVQRPTSAKAGSCGIQRGLPLEQLRGARVRVEARVKADGVAQPPNAWNGVECMLYANSPQGPRWTQRNSVFGTFDWKWIRFIAEVPLDVTEARLVLGLEETTGRVWFDDVKITVIGVRRPVPVRRPMGPVYKGHDRPRLRGAMIGHRVTAEDLRVLGGTWRANHVRWQLIWGGFPHGPADRAGVDKYREWLESALAQLDALLPLCEELGIRVLIDMHTPPGGRDEAKVCRMFQEPEFQQAFVELWEGMARRYRGNRVIWGYDLVNEPVEGVLPTGLMGWHALATVTAKAIRQIDAEHAIIIEPAPWGSPASLDWFPPLDVPRVVYSVHMYQPHAFTHQGVHGNPTGLSYPGTIDGKHWDRDALRQALQPVIEYQRDYNVHMYIGEFSAIRWAPGDSASRYLNDCIHIFETQGWDWAYHAFREWDGWSVEHGADPNNHTSSETPTQREQLLRRWFAENAK